MTADDDEDRGNQEDAAAEHQIREPEVDGRQDERRGAKRLEDADEQIAAIGALPQAVEVGEVQAGLRDERHDEGLEPGHSRAVRPSRARRRPGAARPPAPTSAR